MISRLRNEAGAEEGNMTINVSTNENLGMNTLVHGYIAGGGPRIVAKLKGWKELKAGDGISFSFKRKHFFDKETTNAIRGGK